MNIAESTALVTGANRGLGRHLANELLSRGATVYAGARNLKPGPCCGCGTVSGRRQRARNRLT